jgi:hypothetical protein
MVIEAPRITICGNDAQWQSCSTAERILVDLKTLALRKALKKNFREVFMSCGRWMIDYIHHDRK